MPELIQINGNLALITTFCASENGVPAFWADIACFFVAGPFFSAVLPPVGYGAQDDLFTYGNGKVFDVLTGKVITFVTTAVPLLPGAGLDGTRPAEQADSVRQASLTFEIFDGDVTKTRDFFLVHG